MNWFLIVGDKDQDSVNLFSVPLHRGATRVTMCLTLHGKWTCISIAGFQSTGHSRCFTTLVTFTHSFIHTLMTEAVMQGVDHQEQFGAQYVAQGYFHMQPGESNLFPSDYWTTHSASWATATQRLAEQLFLFLALSVVPHIEVMTPVTHFSKNLAFIQWLCWGNREGCHHGDLFCFLSIKQHKRG